MHFFWNMAFQNILPTCFILASLLWFFLNLLIFFNVLLLIAVCRRVSIINALINYLLSGLVCLIYKMYKCFLKCLPNTWCMNAMYICYIFDMLVWYIVCIFARFWQIGGIWFVGVIMYGLHYGDVIWAVIIHGCCLWLQGTCKLMGLQCM